MSYQLLRLFPGRRDSPEPGLVVAAARQAGSAAQLNQLIHVDFCLSPTDDIVYVTNPNGKAKIDV